MTDTTETVRISTKLDSLSTSDFLMEKLKNFQAFLTENLPNEELCNQVAAISTMSLPLVYTWITEELQKEADLDQYVDKLFVKYEIDKTQIDTHVIDKVKRYFECFISCV